MDTKLQILTTTEHELRVLAPGRRPPAGLCVAYSRGGVSSISNLVAGFHIAYLGLDEIKARPLASAPRNTKLLLRPRHGRWVIGALSDSTRGLYVEWAPLPKLPPELKGDHQGVRYFSHALIDEAVELFSSFRSYATDTTVHDRRVASIRTLMTAASLEAPDTVRGLSTLIHRIRQPGEDTSKAGAALMEVLPYLTGARGPYSLEFWHGDGPVASIEMDKGTSEFDVRDAQGAPIAHAEVTLQLRRRNP